jgi:PKD repeat protein
MVTRISSQDLGYTTGALSLYPEALDSKYQLYEATNNSETTLKQSLTYNGKYVIVDDNSTFPENGLLRIGPAPGKSGPAELIYYDSKANGIFKNIIRGFAGSLQVPWPVGSYVTNSVTADNGHNAIKDAILNIETNIGVEILPEQDSLNGILKQQETRFLSPRPLFRAFPNKGAPPLKVRFQNFSTGPLIRYLWDFGDGTTSAEKSPTHTYLTEGTYTVTLNITTSLGAQGVVTKSNYITVNQELTQPFFYVSPSVGLSKQTALELSTSPTQFTFVDQTDGDIIQRYWVLDGAGTSGDTHITTESIPIYNPNIHTIDFIYDSPGEYQPSLLILFESQLLKKAFLNTSLIVS